MKSPYAEIPEKIPGGITPDGWRCRQMIWELSRRTIGVSVTELGPGNGKIAESGVRRMLTLGQIFIGRPNGQTRGRGVRYFASQQAADTYFQTLPVVVVTSAKRKHRKKEVDKAIPGGPARTPGEPVFTANTVYTIAPPPVRALYSNTYPRG